MIAFLIFFFAGFHHTCMDKSQNLNCTISKENGKWTEYHRFVQWQIRIENDWLMIDFMGLLSVTLTVSNWLYGMLSQMKWNFLYFFFSRYHRRFTKYLLECFKNYLKSFLRFLRNFSPPTHPPPTHLLLVLLNFPKHFPVSAKFFILTFFQFSRKYSEKFSNIFLRLKFFKISPKFSRTIWGVFWILIATEISKINQEYFEINKKIFKIFMVNYQEILQVLIWNFKAILVFEISW